MGQQMISIVHKDNETIADITDQFIAWSEMYGIEKSCMITMIDKFCYRSDIHDLLYPKAYIKTTDISILFVVKKIEKSDVVFSMCSAFIQKAFPLFTNLFIDFDIFTIYSLHKQNLQTCVQLSRGNR